MGSGQICTETYLEKGRIRDLDAKDAGPVPTLIPEQYPERHFMFSNRLDAQD
jgi:hypothetical protein